MYMPNASHNARRPNATYIPRTGVGGDTNFRDCISSKIPTCWYPQRNIMASGVLPNANPRRQVFCVAVEYMLNILILSIPVYN